MIELLSKIETPCHILIEELLEKNLKILDQIQKECNCKILLALKAFAMFSTFSQINQYLAGVCCSGLNESLLGREEFNKEVHTFSPSFKKEEFPEIIQCSDYIIFNSLTQFQNLKDMVPLNKKIGIRINPQKSVANEKYDLYDPCRKYSRLGITLENLHIKPNELIKNKITGIHIHALCEQGIKELKIILNEIENKFDEYLRNIQWINLGGGHLFTNQDYNLNELNKTVKIFRNKYPNIKDIYFEPGEAIVSNAGIFVTSIIDIIDNEKQIVITDSSVETHFSDILITKNEKTPITLKIIGHNIQNKYKYIIAGSSCAAGDIYGEYAFDKPLQINDKLIFTDTAHYTMVKTNTFNGINIPSIIILKKSGKIQLIKKFNYFDYKNRLS